MANTFEHVAALRAVKLSCGVYQRMIDRGWRRCGTYCYKPDLKKTCCPQYTIRLDALAFKAGRSHRKLVHKWNRYVIHGQGEEILGMDGPVKRAKGRGNSPFDLVKELHSVEHDALRESSMKHRFEVTLEPSSFTQEKFKLYCKYQKDIHHEDDKNPAGFKSFLVDSPLQGEAIAYASTPPPHLPETYGSYHQLYRIDGKLIAVAVLDILPNCVSSVYFMYDKEWEQFSLGKLSALREVSLAYEINKAGAQEMNYLYMGYYIQSCQKMRYKGEYSPSYLADPETYEWFPLEKCVPLLKKNRYGCFSDPSHSIEGEWSSTEEPDDSDPDPGVWEGVHIVQRTGKGLVAIPLPVSPVWEDDDAMSDFKDCIRGLGIDLAEDIFWAVS